MASSEEGGELPIRKYVTGEYHVEGDIVLASKERLYLFFKNCLPFLTLLAGRKVIFLTPMPRYLYVGCCNVEDHAPNRQDPDFESKMRKELQGVRDMFKDFLFTSGLRGFVVRNPGVCVPKEDASGQPLWGNEDPVHPLTEGYNLIGDLLCEEIVNLTKKKQSGKRAGGHLEAAKKRPRMEVPRPRWVEETSSATTRQDGYVPGGSRGRFPRGRFNNGWRAGRGGRGGRGGPGGRGGNGGQSGYDGRGRGRGNSRGFGYY